MNFVPINFIPHIADKCIFHKDEADEIRGGYPLCEVIREINETSGGLIEKISDNRFQNLVVPLGLLRTLEQETYTNQNKSLPDKSLPDKSYGGSKRTESHEADVISDDHFENLITGVSVIGGRSMDGRPSVDNSKVVSSKKTKKNFLYKMFSNTSKKSKKASSYVV
jgi:hypothetical protein